MKYQILKNDSQKSKGFTLIELIIVMAVFMLIVGVSIAIFLSIIKSQRAILAQEQMLSQISYTMEYISKGLRMAKKDADGSCLVYVDSGSGEITDTFAGYTYLYTKPVSGYYTGIKFINQSNSDACQEFYLDSSGSNGVVKELKNQVNESFATALTSDKFNIDYLKFSINGTEGLAGGISGASAVDVQQPRTTIIMGFKVPEDDSQSEVKIQTTVSQRNLNESN